MILIIIIIVGIMIITVILVIARPKHPSSLQDSPSLSD